MSRPGPVVWALLPGVLLALAGCVAGSPSAEPAVELRVGAAASLRTAARPLADAYTRSHPGTAVTVTTDSSAVLRAQIEQGAPIDVLLSADTANPQALARAGLAAGEPTPFAANTLALVTPADNPAGIASPADLARPGVRVIAAGEHVPISAYAGQVLAALAATAGYPPDFVAAVEANVVSREDNVAAVLAKIELGEGDAAFVYATDAAGNPDVALAAIPPGANVRARYDGVAVAASPHRGEAEAFLAWVAGPEGRAILRANGLLDP